MMFNGRTLDGKFRRGFWKKADLDALQDADKPDLQGGASGLFANGGWQWIIYKSTIRKGADMYTGLSVRIAPNASQPALDALKICYPNAVQGEPLDAVKRAGGGCIKHDANYFMDL